MPLTFHIVVKTLENFHLYIQLLLKRKMFSLIRFPPVLRLKKPTKCFMLRTNKTDVPINPIQKSPWLTSCSQMAPLWRLGETGNDDLRVDVDPLNANSDCLIDEKVYNYVSLKCSIVQF